MALDNQDFEENQDVPNTGGSIFTFDQYKASLVGRRREGNERVEKLEKLQKYLYESGLDIQDPVAYLHKIYFGGFDSPRMTVEKLWTETKDKGINFATADGLHKMLGAFGWHLFPNQEKTQEGGQNSANNSHNSRLREESVEKFRRKLIGIIGDTITDTNFFNIEEYTSIRFGIDKALYLLRLKPKDIQMIQIASELGKNSLTQGINAIIQEICVEIRTQTGVNISPPNIQKGSVGNLLNKLAD